MSTWRPIARLPRWLSWLPAWTHRPLRWTLRTLLLLALVLGAVALFYFVRAARYDLDAVAELPAPTVILDRHGRQLETGADASRRLARRDDIPPFLVDCLLAREDARFFSHPGVDLRGLARATLRNLKDREFTQGASTLTMQLARNTYEIREKSIHRKLLEIALTLRIEARYSKDEILTHYLNRIYFGAGCHGIDEAARTYFGLPVSELGEAQCAMLVGIIRGPHVFSPFRNLPGAHEQKNEVLDRLVETGGIHAEHRRVLESSPIRLVPEEERGGKRSYALQAVHRELDRILSDVDIREGGLTVHTTLDPSWLLILQSEMNAAAVAWETEPGWSHPVHSEHPPGDPPDYLQCAAVTVETRTGAILALCGGRDFGDSRFDRTTRARRDLGGAYAPFIAAAAAERGKLILPNKPVQTGRQIGPAEVARIAKRCGITGPFLDTEDQFRGSAAASPTEAAVGLGVLANGGVRCQTFLVRKVSDASGRTLYTGQETRSQALNSSSAEQALGLFTTHGGSRCFYGATGSGCDAWLLRVGPSGSTAIWFGFDQPTRLAPQPRIQSGLKVLADRLGG